MKAKRILCPVDFSSTSDVALNVASSFARENAAKLFIVHVEENPVPFGTGLYGTVPSPVNRNSHMLWSTLPMATNVTFEHDLLLGDPARELSRFIDEKDIDLVVIGSHGRTGISRLLMGSVAEALVRHSPVPVLTVKDPAKKLADVVA